MLYKDVNIRTTVNRWHFRAHPVYERIIFGNKIFEKILNIFIAKSIDICINIPIQINQLYSDVYLIRK